MNLDDEDDDDEVPKKSNKPPPRVSENKPLETFVVLNY